MRGTTVRINALATHIFGATSPLLLMSLPAILITLALFAFTALHARVASADTGSDSAADTSTARRYEPWLWLKCLDEEVEEGDDYRLEIRRKGGIDGHLNDTMRVYWFTDPGTADESDYHALDEERQASNGYQTRVGRMGRDFHTREDQYPETDETFTVRFENSVDYGDDDYCNMTITDDDVPGIYDLSITTRAWHTWYDPDSGHSYSFARYIEGDVIEIKANFTDRVTMRNPSTGKKADYAGIQIRVGEDLRVAELLRGNGTNTLTFGYTVQRGDYDPDGIGIIDSGFYYNVDAGDIGLWTEHNGQDVQANGIYHGLDDQSAHKVDWEWNPVGEPFSD